MNIFKIIFLFIYSLQLFAGNSNYFRDIFPDTWVATDALGRKMPDYSICGPPKNDMQRVVGIFYITWHMDRLHNMKSPYTADVSKILKKDPRARFDSEHPLWTETSLHCCEPEAGYFLSKDKFVIRKDLSMLADAGVDVLILDVTNAKRYWEEWDALFEVMRAMKNEGNKVPKFCFWAFNGPVVTVVQQLYDRIYKTGKSKDFWFYWDGKPLLLYNKKPAIDANPKTPKNDKIRYSKEVKNFFTLRNMWWGYYNWAGERFVGTEDNWSFGYDLGDAHVRELPPRKLVSTHKGKKEEFAVTPAQHASSMIGRSWTRKNGEPKLNEYDLPVPTYVPWLRKKVKHPEGYGIYFQERWDEALKVDPPFIYINDWNEWTAGKYPPRSGKTVRFMRRESPYFFVDQYNTEFSRTIQPMKGGFTDNYYMQMAQNIRKYKGAREIPELRGYNKIFIDGFFNDWKKVKTEYRDTIGDNAHRDYNGYGGLHYQNLSGRNDIITCKVAVNKKSVYFFAETREPLTSRTENNWMLLFIDADKNSKTGWFGYDFLINKSMLDRKFTMLKKYNTKTKKWVDVAPLLYRFAYNKLELALPRRYLKLGKNNFTFDFHWADNPEKLDTQIDLCVNGDSAPNRRFNYRCVWRR